MKIDWLSLPKKRINLNGMDSLRGIAALLVFGFHFWGIFLRDTAKQSDDVFGFLSAGHLGVDMFFVLSGLLITLSLLFSKNTTTYFERRFRRIVPLAWSVAIILFLFFQDFSNFALADFWIHIGFGQSLFQDFYYGLNPVMWTLSVEMIFYLFLPLAFWIGRKNQVAFWSFLSLLLILNFWYRDLVQVLFPFMDRHDKIFISEQFWGRFDQFFYGMVLALGLIVKKELPDFLKKHSLVWIICGLAGMLLGFKLFAVLAGDFRDFPILQIWLHSFFGLSFAAFLWGGMLRPQKISQSNVLEFLGKISYGIYIWHFVVMEEIEKITTDPMTAFILSVSVTLLVSQVSWHIIEKPFLRKKESESIRKNFHFFRKFF